MSYNNKRITNQIKTKIMKNRKITKKQIAEEIRSKEITGIRTYHEYVTNDEKFSVNTFKFSTENEQVENENGHGVALCETKKDFVNFLYEELNK